MVRPPAAAVRVTVWAVVTAETVAVKPMLVAPAGTVADAGTVTALLLLARLTASPPVPAAALSVTVQASVPAPVSEPWLQLNESTVGSTESPGEELPLVPEPLKLTANAGFSEELLAIVSCPVAEPAAEGLKLTLKL